MGRCITRLSLALLVLIALSGVYLWAAAKDAKLNLAVAGLPDMSHPLDVMTLESGEWWLKQQLDDRPVLLESRRLPAVEMGDEAVYDLIWRQWRLSQNIGIEPFPELSEKLSYPVLKAKFQIGESEDIDQSVAALVFTDDWTFLFALEADTLADTKRATVEQEMEELLLNIGEVNPEDGGFLPGSGLPVYNSGAEALPDMSVMSALIIIKKVISPELNLRAGESSPYPRMERLAYRYDGIGEVAGLQALLFSFGGDAEGKFTAERHFAVNFMGEPFEMNPADSPEYKSVEDALVVIKRDIDPDTNPRYGDRSPNPGEGQLAYRYAGTGEAAGEPALFFALGGGAAREFTAERHFAVGESETVYEMKPADRPEYRRAEKEPRMWLGEFRSGDRTLDISVYDQGRRNMHFEGIFFDGEKEPRRIFAGAEGRNARTEGLEFVLSDDDSTIMMTVEESGDVFTLKRFDGIYGRSPVKWIPLVSTLGFDIEAVYAHLTGSEPWILALSPTDGEPVDVNVLTQQRSRRMIVKREDEENPGKEPPLQFFTKSYLSNADRMELTLSDIRKVPVLLTEESGERDAALAGLPLDILLSFLESEDGMDAKEYTELMMPLGAGDWEEYPCALVSGGLSWSLLAPGSVFRKDEDGVERLSEIAFATVAPASELMGRIEAFKDHGITLREQNDQGIFFESPRAFYELRFGSETQELPGTVELRFKRNAVASLMWQAEALNDQKEYARALPLYLRAAEAGSAEAQIMAGLYYAEGRGIEESQSDATEWYRKAAEQGHVIAQFNLGVRYDNGRGVDLDDAQAVKWYRKAAEQGDADAQYNLGVMYANGEGVAKDDTQALQWIQKSAEQGDEDAQEFLSKHYRDGRRID